LSDEARKKKKKVNCGFAGKIASGEQQWRQAQRAAQHYKYTDTDTDTSD
jgi:hypothetical protein